MTSRSRRESRQFESGRVHHMHLKRRSTRNISFTSLFPSINPAQMRELIISYEHPSEHIGDIRSKFDIITENWDAFGFDVGRSQDLSYRSLVFAWLFHAAGLPVVHIAGRRIAPSYFRTGHFSAAKSTSSCLELALDEPRYVTASPQMFLPACYRPRIDGADQHPSVPVMSRLYLQPIGLRVRNPKRFVWREQEQGKEPRYYAEETRIRFS